VVLNLLSNAAKFVPAQGRAGRPAAAAPTPAGCTVEVQDNGPGVPPEQQQLIFEKFRQGGDAANRPQGTGLGLPISRQIVEHFGGRMWLRPDPVKAPASPSLPCLAHGTRGQGHHDRRHPMTQHTAS
jgi:signal transduction histidine kinase